MTDPHPEAVDDLVVPHLAGKLPGEQADRAHAFLEADPSRRGALAGLRAALQYEEFRRGAPDVQTSLARLRSRLDRLAAPQERQTLLSGVARERSSPPFAPIAGVRAAWWRRGDGRVTGVRVFRSGVSVTRTAWRTGAATFAAVTAAFLLWRSGPVRDAGTTATYATGIGQLATVRLRDGTRVTMAPQTTLRLTGFGRSTRTVAVDGEAYFEVTQAAGAPFTIRSGDVVTRVLGTAFTVRHYRGDRDVRVAVASGKVSVLSRASRRLPTTVTAGHVARVTGSLTVVTAADTVAPDGAWMYDRLVFDEVPMTEVFATLHRWYGYEFRCADSTMTRRNVTVGLSARSSAEALSTLEQLLNVTARVEGRTITLIPQPAGATSGKLRRGAYDMLNSTREVGR